MTLARGAARGQRRRWRQADRNGERRRRQHHRAHSVTVIAERRGRSERHITRFNPIGHIRSTLRSPDEAPRQGSGERRTRGSKWSRPSREDFRDRHGRRGHRHHLASSCGSRRARGAPARRSRGPARRRVYHTVAGPAEPVGAPSRHRARDLGTRLRIGPIEAIDGTPVVDIKAVLDDRADVARAIRVKERNFKNPEIAFSDPFAELAKMNKSPKSVPVPISRCLSGISLSVKVTEGTRPANQASLIVYTLAP